MLLGVPLAVGNDWVVTEQNMMGGFREKNTLVSLMAGQQFDNLSICRFYSFSRILSLYVNFIFELPVKMLYFSLHSSLIRCRIDYIKLTLKFAYQLPSKN